jgi:hypothetical protein
LPFINKFDDLKEPLIFNNSKVKAFGLSKYKVDQAKIVDILYYKNDNEFIISLLTADSEHEVILAKGINMNSNLRTSLDKINSKIKKGINERSIRSNLWKSYFLENDSLSIPRIYFNIQNSYKDIENKSFKTKDGKSHIITNAEQSISFNLDKCGISLKDIASWGVDSTGKIDIPKPKKLFFDKPFIVIMRKKNSDIPYFMLNVRNTEVLIKE